MDLTYVPLRIPAGWYVLYNTFFELDPVVEGGRLVHPDYFWQDMLCLRQIQPTAPSPTLGPYVLDLGWYPDGSEDGRFRLVLLFEGWDNILHTVESRDWRVIRDGIERALDAVNRSFTTDEVLSRLIGV